MSALGQKQTFGRALDMSALPPKADIPVQPDTHFLWLDGMPKLLFPSCRAQISFFVLRIFQGIFFFVKPGEDTPITQSNLSIRFATIYKWQNSSIVTFRCYFTDESITFEFVVWDWAKIYQTAGFSTWLILESTRRAVSFDLAGFAQSTWTRFRGAGQVHALHCQLAHRKGNKTNSAKMASIGQSLFVLSLVYQRLK